MRWTNRAHGDARPRREGPARPWEGVATRPVFWLRQVHGDRVVVVKRPCDPPVQEGDALLTTRADVALGVLTADCAPVALASPQGVVGAVHAGWAGLAGGVLERAVETMRALGAGRVEAAVGPCIRPECYQFGSPDLDQLADQFGPSVRAATGEGAPALDLAAAVGAALKRCEVDLVHDEDECTSCAVDAGGGHRYFSHRARRERERQAMVAWRE